MTAPMPPNLEELMAALGAVSGKLAGREGDAIRRHLQQLLEVLAQGGTQAAPDAELRARAGGALDQLITALVQLLDGRGAAGSSLRGVDLKKLADDLRAFAEFLRSPTSENQAQAEQLIEQLQGSPFQPVPLDQLKLDSTLDVLAAAAARRQGLTGAEARSTAERMKSEARVAIRRFELRAHDEAARAATAAQLDQLLDQLIETGTPVAQAVAGERASLVAQFRSVDLVHMSDGLRTFAAWLTSPVGDDLPAQLASLRAQWAAALGAPTHKDPARSDAEKRFDFERELASEVHAIFGTTPTLLA